MQISSRCTIAIHMLIGIDYFGKTTKVTSGLLAMSIQVNPVIVRNILVQRREAGLVQAARGTGGIRILHPLDEITIYDVYRAVEAVPEEELFHFHEKPNPDCPVGRNIHRLLDDRLIRVQEAMEEEMRAHKLSDLAGDLATILKAESEACNLS